MSLKELVLCKYIGCNLIYETALFLPCGNRTCEKHIENMKINSEAKINCYFCSKIHSIPAEGFPKDELIEKFLNIDHSDKHQEAKKSFKDLNQLILKLSNIKHEEYLYDYFKNIELEIELEREQIKLKIDEHYEELLKQLNNYKAEFLLQFDKENEKNYKFDLIDHIRHDLKKKNYEFDLMTLNGKEEKWSQMKEECDLFKKKIQEVKKLFEKKLFNNKTIKFNPHEQEFNLINICGKLNLSCFIFDSKILDDNKKTDLINLCCLHNEELKLLYRGSEEIFSAQSFHEKCNKAPRTLTIIKSTSNNIFGGYVDVSWNKKIGWISDPNAFLFSLVNQEEKPTIIKCKNPEKAIYNHNSYGPTFGGGYDIHISNFSNKNNESYSSLGHSYDSNKGDSYLAGSHKFQTVEIEVFEVLKF